LVLALRVDAFLEFDRSSHVPIIVFKTTIW